MARVPAHPSRRGITLIESLIASALLLTVVTAILSALSAGHQHSREAQGLVTASLAAEQLMAKVSSDAYGSLPEWDGWDEKPGTLVDEDRMPTLFTMIGRRVLIRPEAHSIEQLQVRVTGYTVTVESYDATGRILTRLVRFIPEPQA
tara:strand:- start:32835 stop:33275 length:441 start_codon:yes stop_codon:yes gene_type:complete